MVRKQNQTKALSLPAPHFPGSTPCLHSQFFFLMLYPGLPRVAPKVALPPLPPPPLTCPLQDCASHFHHCCPVFFPVLDVLHGCAPSFTGCLSSNCVPSLFSQLSQGLGFPSPTLKPLSWSLGCFWRAFLWQRDMGCAVLLGQCCGVP